MLTCRHCGAEAEETSGLCLDCYKAAITADHPIAALLVHLFRGVVDGLYQAGLSVEVGDIFNATIGFLAENIINQERPENWKKLMIGSLDEVEAYLAKREKDARTAAGEQIN